MSTLFVAFRATVGTRGALLLLHPNSYKSLFSSSRPSNRPGSHAAGTQSPIIYHSRHLRSHVRHHRNHGRRHRSRAVRRRHRRVRRHHSQAGHHHIQPWLHHRSHRCVSNRLAGWHQHLQGHTLQHRQHRQHHRRHQRPEGRHMRQRQQVRDHGPKPKVQLRGQ